MIVGLWRNKCTESFQAFVWLFISISLVFLTGCGSDEIQLPDKDLQGKINGNDWQYSGANAFLASTNGQYRVRFLSDQEHVSDPCTLPAPGLAHAKAIFKPFIGTFTVSPQAIADNEVLVAFEISPSTTLTANSGFMEIYDINNRVIYGYLQAVLDTDNTVDGSFQIILCDF